MNKLKAVIILTTILLVSTSFILSSENIVKASVTLMEDTGVILQNNTVTKSNDQKVLFEELRHLAYNLNNNKFLNKEISNSERLTDENNWYALTPWEFKDVPFARVNNDMKLQNEDTLAAHNASFTNDTGIEQTMLTASFKHTQTDSVTTTTNHSTGVSLTTSAEMKFPFVSGSMSMNVSYDFSHTKSVQSTVIKEWAVPSQSIKVPAGHKYKVSWVLNTGVATGTTDLTSQVNAQIPFKMSPNGTRYSLGIGDAINIQKRLVSTLPSTGFLWPEGKNWEQISGGTALRKWGTSTYKAKFGTELIMNIMDVTNTKAAPAVVKSIPMNIIPTVVK